MRSVTRRCWFGLAVLSLGMLGEAWACTNPLATAGALVPAIVPSSIVVPQMVLVPQVIAVQPLAVPHVLQQQVIRQRVRTTVMPRSGLRSLFCR